MTDEGWLSLSMEEIVTKNIFGRAEPPRWVILASDAQIVLIDRGKWNEKRLLRFDLGEILGRRESSTLQAMAALLHRESICPEGGISLLDTLDENSHKHAFAVSEDLKYALREAIELIGNEAVWFLSEKHHEKIYAAQYAEGVQAARYECHGRLRRQGQDQAEARKLECQERCFIRCAIVDRRRSS